MEEVANTDEPSDPVREPIKGRTIIVGDWFTYRGKRYKVVHLGPVSDYTDTGELVNGLEITMVAAR